MDHGPVGAAHQRHMEELRVLHQLVEGRGGAGAAGRAADGGRLIGQIFSACIREAVHEAGHVAGSRGIVHRGAEHEGVGGLGLLDGLVDHPAEDAAIACGTAAAADAAAYRLGAHVQDLGLDAGGVQFPGDEGQCSVGAALLVGAAVDEQNFHVRYSPFCALWCRRSDTILAHLCRQCNESPGLPLTKSYGMTIIIRLHKKLLS